MLHKVNVALQVLPSSSVKHPYDIVDHAISIIQKSGIKYVVTPFETVMEGDYDEIMQVVKQIQLSCLEYGAEGMLSNLKIQVARNKDVFIDDKTGKYQK